MIYQDWGVALTLSYIVYSRGGRLACRGQLFDNGDLLFARFVNRCASLSALALLIFGCATSLGPGRDPASYPKDAQARLALGHEWMGQGAHAGALNIFLSVLGSGGESAPEGLFFAARCLEALGKHADAIDRYHELIENYPKEVSRVKEAHFRLAIALSELELWSEVQKVFSRVRGQFSLSTIEEVEARVGAGVALFMQEEFDGAETAFKNAVMFYEEHERQEYLPGEYFLGQSRFYLGEIYSRSFEASDITRFGGSGPVWFEHLGAALEEKCELLLKAQAQLVKAIRVGHAGWATAAGYRIGSLYESLYDDFMQVPVPSGLDEEARAYYIDEVKSRVGVLVAKAMQVYEQSIEMAERTGENNEWVHRASESLRRMKSLYKKPKQEGPSLPAEAPL